MPRWFAIMTPVHHTRIFRCCHTTGMTVVPWDGVTSSSSAGKAGGLLCFLQPLRFWDGPCFSTSRGLAAPLLGTRTSNAKVKVAECTMHVGQEGKKPPIRKRLLFKDCIDALVNKSWLSALCKATGLHAVMEQHTGIQ